MLDTKELLEARKPPVEEIVINLLEEGPTIPWTLESIGAGLDLDLKHAGYQVGDGRSVSPMVRNWLGCHGFDLKPDGKTGWFVISQQNGATYRLRIATEWLTLAPSITQKEGWSSAARMQMKSERSKIHGWAIVFMADLPSAPVYFVAESLADFLQQKELLDDKWKGNSIKLKAYFVKALNEGQL